MNLPALVTAVETRIGNPSTDGFYTTAQKEDLVNEGLSLISTDHDWPWLFGTANVSAVAADGDYAVPADWCRTRSLVIDGYAPLVLLSAQEIRAISTTDRGQPLYYTIDDDQILVRPLPDASYTIIHDYVKVEPILATTATPLMPAQFHYAIVAAAASLAFLRAGDGGRAAAAERAVQAWLQRMRSFKRRAAGPRRVVVRPGSAI